MSLTGSYGCRLYSPLKSQHSQGRSKPQDQGTPKGYCFKFHREVDFVAGVLLNISVISSKAHIQSVGVIFMARVEPLQTTPYLPSPNLKNYNLPMPVIVERLDFLLSGYNHSIAVSLSSVFKEGFPLHCEGDPGCLDAKNLNSASENPRCSGCKNL